MIRLNDKWIIKGNGKGMTLYEVMIRGDDVKVGEPGTQYLRSTSHGTTLTEVLNAYADHLKREVLTGDEPITINEAIRRLKEIDQHIKELIQERTGGV